MRRSSLLPSLAAFALLAGTAAGAGAATWSAPQTISQPHTFAGPLIAATRADGGVVVGWPWQDNVGANAVGGWATATRAPAAPTFGAQTPTVAGLTALGPFARTQSIAVGMQAIPNSPGPGGAIRYRIRASVNGGTARSLAVAATRGAPVLASAPNSSSALVAYIEFQKTSSGGIRRIVRTVDRRNGTWSAPSTISGRGHADAIAAAMGSRGDAVVVFVRDGKLLARLRRPGHNWGSMQQLAVSAPSSRTSWSLAAAIDGRGQVRVVWRRHPFRGVSELRTAAVPVGRNTFTAPQTLIADGAAADFRIAPAAPGWAIADVETPAGQAPRPLLFTTTGSIPFGPGLTAAPPQGGLRGAVVVANGDGSLTVAWVQPLPDEDSDGQIRAATLPGTTAGAFGPVEDVSPAEAAHEVLLVPGQPGPTAVWTARPGGTGLSVPIAQLRTLVRVATRTP
ncbi:MAG TPA: hypothetical protein VFG42_11665 [Baekduia sp.]|uniref:hypothetical protein n=1 Tax=Baekduia sp. TaxID=2600305 RepID=UPI002D76D28F|nr:hypothetical protein [Baekduia sp.]HET6507436.1 hypothetical protein [Baekduia sp.]